MKTIHYIIGIALIIVLTGLFVFGADYNSSDTNNTKESGSAQEITLSYKDYNYYPNTITVKSGEPVRIYLDSSVRGCFRSFVIKDFGVKKYLKTPTDYVEFTPNKKGTFTFMCSMGMGTGKLIVE